MNQAQAHRGPDDEGVYQDPAGRMCLGARRLSIIDVEGGHQPLCNEDRTIWAVLNGELYNSRALQRRLGASGHRLRSYADTETLVHLYEEYDVDLVHALEGMFALAIWDERRGILFLVRDRFGEKPLFYRSDNAGFTFASELSALAGGAPGDLDLSSVDAYFVLGYVPGPSTVLTGVSQLQPGHSLVWDARTGGVVERQYWCARRTVTVDRESEPELAAETTRLLRRAVRSVLVSDRPVGVFLSGGLDSTLVTALVASEAPARTFSVGYDVGDVSELAAARATAAHFGTSHHELVMDAADVEARVPKVLANLDQPLADPAVVPLHAVSELARREVPVVISGEGADELFGGYPRYRWLIRSAQIKHVLPESWARGAAGLLGTPGLGHSANRLSEVLAPQTTLDRHLDWVTARRRYARADMYGERLSGQLQSDHAIASLFPHITDFEGELDADAFMQLDQRHWLPDDVLTKSDRAGMLNSLEIRTPYLARDVAEFANSVNAATHLGGWGKRLLRASAAELLPDRTARWRKRAFRVPCRQWLEGPLRDLVEHQVRHGALVEGGFIDPGFALETFKQHEAGHDRTSLLWPMLAFGLWLDGRASLRTF